jgi:Tol biopolymer transport system component
MSRVYLYNIAAQTWTQAVPDPTGLRFPPSTPLSLNYDGTIIPFSDYADLTGTIRTIVRKCNFLTLLLRTFTQVTDAQTAYHSPVPSISADATKIAFVSDADHVPGHNLDHNLEVFLATCPAARTNSSISMLRLPHVSGAYCSLNQYLANHPAVRQRCQ